MKSFRCLTSLGLALGLLAAPQVEAVLISVKSLGMAGVGIGYAQDAMAAAHNPGSAAVIGNRYDLGLTFAHLHGNLHIEGSALDGLVDGHFNSYHRPKHFWSPNFGINYDLNCDWTIGLVVYNRDLSKTTYKNSFFLLGTTPAGIEYVNETISPYVAYRWGCHNFGVSFNWQVSRLKINGFQNFDNPVRSVAPGHVTNEGYNYSNGLGVTFGWYWLATDTINIGASYQPKCRMSRFKKYKGFLADHGKFDQPQKIGAGISWRFIECATLALDYEFVDWKQNSAVHNSLLHDGVVQQAGSKQGPGFGWRSKHYFRLGADYALCDDWIVRAGIRYAPTQIRRSQTVLNAFTMEPLVETVVTAGATWYLSCCNEIDVFGGYGFNKKVKGKNSIPPSFGGGEANLNQDLWVVGISWGHRF